MPEAKATIVITARNQAGAELQKVFLDVNAAMGKTTQAATQQKGVMQSLGSTYVDLAAKLYLVQVGLRNIIRVAEAIFEFGKLGATVEQTTKSFASMTESVGSNARLLDTLREASHGTVSDLELMQAAQTALIGLGPKVGASFAEALPHILEIARAANIANPALGDTAFLFESLTIGLKRLSSRLIDNTGLQLKLGAAQEKYAATIGTTVEKLSAEDKQMALLIATLDAGDRLIKQIGGDTESATDPFARFTATLKNLRNEIAEQVSPILSEMFSHLTDTIGNVEAMVDKNKDLAGVLNNLLIPLKGYLVAIVGIDAATAELSGDSEKATRIWQQFNAIMIGGLNDLGAAGGRMGSEWGTIWKQLEPPPDADEEMEKFVEKRNRSLDSMFERELEIANRASDRRADINDRIEDDERDLAEKLIEIHDDAERERSRITADAAEDRLQTEQDYNERIADARADIAQLQAELEGKNPFVSPETQQELKDVQQNYEDLTSTLKRLRREQRLNPTDEREAEIARYEERIDEVRQHLQDIQDRAREEERKNRILARIIEKEEERKHLEEMKQQELAIITAKEREKLDAIAAGEKDITAKTIIESDTRLQKLQNEFAQIAIDADRQLRIAVVDALLAIAPAGSKVASDLMDMKFKMLGASDEMILKYHEVRESISGPDGLVGAVNLFGVSGFGTFFGMQGVIAGMNMQLMMTNAQLVMAAANANYYGAVMIGTSTRRQGGGQVMAGHPYLVGEAGPEIMVPKGGGTIIPNDGIGGGASISINVSAGVFQGSQADAKRFADWVGPLVMKYMDNYGGNPVSVGSRKIRS